MNNLTQQFLRRIGYVAVIVIPSWLFFGPIAAFHHMVRCGLLGVAFLDGEAPRSGVPLFLGEYDVHLFPGRLAVSILLWVVCVILGWRYMKRLQ